ncbi:hypothetical protein N2152v2_004092 [Parachlorella kessleri]
MVAPAASGKEAQRRCRCNRVNVRSRMAQCGPGGHCDLSRFCGGQPAAHTADKSEAQPPSVVLRESDVEEVATLTAALPTASLNGAVPDLGLVEEEVEHIGSIAAETDKLEALALCTVFATGALRLVGRMLDPERGVMPLSAEDLDQDGVLGLADHVKQLATLRCGEQLERLLAPHFWGRTAHLAEELVTADELSPVMKAAQRSNYSRRGMLRYLHQKVVGKLAALPLEEQAAPETVSEFMGKALERMSTPGYGVVEAVRAVREFLDLYDALRGITTHDALTAVEALGIGPMDAPPSRRQDSVREELYHPLEMLFTEELFTKLAAIISSILPEYRVANNVFFMELFEEAIVPLLDFLEELLCDGLLVRKECADVIKGVVGQVREDVSEVTIALYSTVLVKKAQNGPLDDNPVLLRTALKQQLEEQAIAAFEEAQGEAHQAELAAAEAAQQVEALVLNAAGPSDSEESEEGAPAESQGGMAGQGSG